MKNVFEIVLKNLKKEELWPWQKEAIGRILMSDKNFLIKAPTGAGKTLIAYVTIAKYIQEDDMVIYAVPSKALVREKFSELKKIFGGDIVKQVGGKDTKAGRIMVGTYEAIFTLLRTNTYLLQDIGLAVLDDFHILYDPHRGPKLEKLITFLLYHSVRILSLSATIKPVEDLARWLDADVIEYQKRPIALEYQFVVCSRRDDLIKFLYTNREKFAPAIVFCKSTKDTQKLALKYLDYVSGRQQLSLDTWTNTKRVTRKKQKFAQDILEAFSHDHDITDDLVDLAKAVEVGVAWHHSKMRPFLRRAVETWFNEGYIDYIFATTTLAHGVNTPCRSVIIYPPTRYCPECHGNKHPYIPIYEWVQMVGRAGRMGLSKGGKAYAVTVVGTTKAKQEVENRFKVENIEEVKSYLEDELPRLIMELISMGYSVEQQILDIVMRSYWATIVRKHAHNAFRLTLLGDPDSEANKAILGIVQGALSDLISNGWILKDYGRGEYKLSKSGKVILDFLSAIFYPIDIEIIRSIELYIKRLSRMISIPVSAHGISLKVIHLLGPIAQIYPPRDNSSVPDDKLRHLHALVEGEGIDLDEVSINAAYTWYILENYWVQGKSEKEINDEWGVWATHISTVSGLIAEVLENLVAPLCEIYGVPLSHEFQDEVKEIYMGMPKNMIILYKGLKEEYEGLKGESARIGRTLLTRLRDGLGEWVKKLPKETAQGVTIQENIQLNSLFNTDFIEFLVMAYKVAPNEFKTQVMKIPGWGPSRTEKLLKFIKRYSGWKGARADLLPTLTS